MKLFTFCLAFSLLLLGCTKENKKEATPDSGIVLTFDDTYIDEWYRILPLLDSYDAKATFYVSNYKSLSALQKQQLKEIEAHGNEIAYHTTNHYNMNEFLRNGKMEDLIKIEILSGLEKMNADGFYPKTFAYPYGQHNDLLNKELLKYFKSVRALNGTTNLAKSIVPGNKNKVLYGLGIDESSKRPFDVILKLLKDAKETKSSVIFVAHHVGRDDLKMQLPIFKLKKILEESERLGLAFQTVSEISN